MIHILELVCAVCGAGHAHESILWDDASHTAFEAAYRLGRLAQPTISACEVCGATSFKLRDHVTEHETLESASRGQTKRCYAAVGEVTNQWSAVSGQGKDEPTRVNGPPSWLIADR